MNVQRILERVVGPALGWLTLAGLYAAGMATT